MIRRMTRGLLAGVASAHHLAVDGGGCAGNVHVSRRCATTRLYPTMPPTVRQNPNARCSAPMAAALHNAPNGPDQRSTSRLVRRYNGDDVWRGHSHRGNGFGGDAEPTVVLALIGIAHPRRDRCGLGIISAIRSRRNRHFAQLALCDEPDRRRQPASARPRSGDRGRQRRSARGCDHGRRRPLQADQRRTRPRCGRSGAAWGCRCVAPRGAVRRCRLPLWRRGVLRRAGRDDLDRGRHRSPNGSASPCHGWRWPSTSH